LILASPGCSLVLDFSDSAAPHDAAIDTPYTADQCAYGEPNDTPDTAAVIAPGTDTGPGAICPTESGVDDLDFYKFTVPAGTTKVTIGLQFTTALGDLDLVLFDSSATMKAQSRGFGDTEQIICPNAPGTTPLCPTLAAGDYYFEVLPGLPGATNYYTFSVALE
jgi:hypothetical protein